MYIQISSLKSTCTLGCNQTNYVHKYYLNHMRVGQGRLMKVSTTYMYILLKLQLLHNRLQKLDLHVPFFFQTKKAFPV